MFPRCYFPFCDLQTYVCPTVCRIRLFVKRIAVTIFPSSRFLICFYLTSSICAITHFSLFCFIYTWFQPNVSCLILVIYYIIFRSWDKSICIATGYILKGPGSIPGIATFFNTEYGDQRVSYPMSVGGYFPGSKAVRSWPWPRTFTHTFLWHGACDSPNLLQFSMDAMVHFSYFGRVTGVLARPIY
jgi:hypothetical protein